MSKGEGQVCTLYLVRHGESEANADKIVQGHTDSPLTEKGEEQARKVAEDFRDIEFGTIYSSDLCRAKQTAEIIGSGRDIKTNVSADLREKNYGVFEGIGHDKFLSELKGEFEKFDNLLSDEERWDHKAHPSIESDRELVDRVTSFLENIARENLGKNVLVVTHRFPIRLLLVSSNHAHYGDLSSGGVKTGGYVVLKSNGTGFDFVEISSPERIGL